MTPHCVGVFFVIAKHLTNVVKPESYKYWDGIRGLDAVTYLRRPFRRLYTINGRENSHVSPSSLTRGRPICSVLQDCADGCLL